MHFTVEKIRTIIFATSVNFTITTQSKHSPNRGKFAQSGHPAHEQQKFLLFSL
jgi:hypothetical protein